MHISIDQKKKYLNRRIEEIETLKRCIQISDFDLAGNIGHKLKGNGVTFGFPEISVIGNRIEQAASERNQLSLVKSIEEFIVIMKSIIES